jgi:hypothetical protein
MVLSEGTMENIPGDITGNRSQDCPASSEHSERHPEKKSSESMHTFDWTDIQTKYIVEQLVG